MEEQRQKVDPQTTTWLSAAMVKRSSGELVWIIDSRSFSKQSTIRWAITNASAHGHLPAVVFSTTAEKAKALWQGNRTLTMEQVGALEDALVFNYPHNQINLKEYRYAPHK